MNGHLPECPSSSPDPLAADCCCSRLRACEQRVADECMKEDSPADKINVTINEYGCVVMTAPLRDGVVPSNVLEAATTMLGNHTQEIREVLDICGDAEIVENFRIVEGPNVDVLKRFKPLGFYGRFASANYDKLQKHFACRKPHQPDEITIEYIQKIILLYADQQRRYDDEEYDDY